MCVLTHVCVLSFTSFSLTDSAFTSCVCFSSTDSAFIYTDYATKQCNSV
jgi:hypothetical protein